MSKRWPPGTMRWSPLRSPVRCSERMIRWAKLVVGDTISATINGGVEDLLHSSIPEADVIVRWEQVRYLNWSLAPDQLGNAGSTSAFCLGA